ncbi:MAG: hypothetical protein Q9N67_05930 [Ghiorsea sp.]|nr:hypothetical protein [Ghiorsea sp.]
MKLKKLLLLGLAVSLLASCQKHFEEEHLKYDATKSKALNIALLTGLTTVEHGPIVDSEPVGHSSNGGKGAAMAAGAFDLLTGGGGLGLMTSFMFNIYQPEWENHVFAWMPQDMAKDEAEAAKVMCEIMYKATKQIVSDDETIIKIEKPYKYKVFSDDLEFGIYVKDKDGYPKGYVSQIATPRIVKGNALFNNSPSYFWSYQKTSNDTSPVLRSGVWLSDIFMIKNKFPDYPTVETSKEKKDEELNKLYNKLSPLLPSWVYIYIAPNLKTKEPAYFLNQGKKLYFIKPTS